MTSSRTRMRPAIGMLLLGGLAAVGLAGAGLRADDSATITAVNFRGVSDPSQVEIAANHPIQVAKTTDAADKQVILEIDGAALDKGLTRKIDTSSFNSNVALISPYQVGGSPPTVRIVIQLRKNVDTTLAMNGNSAVLSVPLSAGSSASSPAQAASTPAPTSAADADNTDTDTDADAALPAPPPSSPAALPSVAAPLSAPPSNDSLGQLVQATKTQEFHGKPITLQVRDVDVQDVFALISQASGFNIVMSGDVKGKLTLSLVDVPWDQALDVVLQTLRLGADRRGNVLRIMTLDALTKQKELELVSKKINDAVAPRITRVFPINYANLNSLQKTLLELANVEASSQKQADAKSIANSASHVPGMVGSPPPAAMPSTGDIKSDPPLVVVTDERTNSIIVRGLPDYVERAKKIIEILDTQTPQVLIEGKIVEASETFSRNIGGTFAGVESEAGHGYGFGSNGGSPYDTLFGAGGTQSSIFDVATSSVNGLSLGYTKLIDGNRLNAVLNLAESEETVKIVSSPRTVVLNKQNASILQSFPAVTEVINVSTVGQTITYQEVDGNLSLNVTPTVTSDGSVLMQLTITRDVVNQLNPQIATVAHRNLTTNVLVDSGNTLVMGGFYNTDDDRTEVGIPWLRDIPIIGWFFGNKTTAIDRDELLFFITPKIINPKKSGFAVATST